MYVYNYTKCLSAFVMSLRAREFYYIKTQWNKNLKSTLTRTSNTKAISVIKSE